MLYFMLFILEKSDYSADEDIWTALEMAFVYFWHIYLHSVE